MDKTRILEAIRQGCVDPFYAARYHKDSPSPAPAPNYAAAAQMTGEQALENQRTATKANRVNQYTPYGSISYNEDAPDTWSSHIALDPLVQSTVNKSNEASNTLASATNDQAFRVNSAYQHPMDQSSVQQTADKAYGAMTARLDPQWQQNTNMQETKLRNQGLVPGGEAYDNAMRTFNEGKNDAYQQANLGAISTMPQTYQLAQSQYMQPMNTYNALRTGAQVNNPQFNGPGQMGAPAGANYAGAAQSQGQYDQGLYNSNVSANNQLMQGLYGLGSAAIMASDRRLKSNIKRIGTHPLGIGIYEYDIFGRHEHGVMADEVETVMPDAVHRHPLGFQMVDYGKL